MNLFFKLWVFEKRLEKGKFRSNEEKKNEAEALLTEVKAADLELSRAEEILKRMKELSELMVKKSTTQGEQLVYQKQIDQLQSDLKQISINSKYNLQIFR